MYSFPNAVAFVFIVYFAYKDYKNYKNNVNKDYKSTIVTIGVLGTFVGILIGLDDFDTKDITNSIPNLLDGLKTAFVTSIMAMFTSLVLYTLQKTKDNQKAETELEALNNINENIVKQNVVLEQFFTFIKSNNENITQVIETQNQSMIKTIQTEHQKTQELLSKLDTLDTINENITSSQDKLFNVLKDEMNKVNLNLNEAINKLSKGATEEIIKALENVISDFNNNLKEQFGSNFNELNESTKNMIEWQKNYKEQIELLETSFKNSTNIMENTSSSLASIDDKFKNIDVTFEKLEKIIKTNDNQINNFEKHLITLNEIGEKSKLYIDEIANFSDTTKEALKNQTIILDDSIKKSTQLNHELETQFTKSLGELNQALTSLTMQFKTDYEFFLEKISHLMKLENRY